MEWEIIVKYLNILVVLVAFACHSKYGPPAPDSGRMIGAMRVYMTLDDFQSSPWGRPSDATELNPPIYVLYDRGRNACITKPEDYVMVQPGDIYRCFTGWRSPRGIR